MKNDQILGIVLVALGALLLLGWLHIPYLVTVLGLILLIVGIMILMGKMRAASWIGVTCVVLGLLLILPTFDPVKKLVGDLLDLAVTIVAVILIILGVMKLMAK